MVDRAVRAKSHGSYQTDPQSYHRKLARILDRMGGLYTLNDILSRVAKNENAIVGRGRLPGP